MGKNKNLRDYFKVDPKLKIKEELVSIHALQPFIAHNSSPRGYMFSGHLSQALTLNHSEEKIVQSGLERQLASNTFSKIMQCEARVIRVLKRYHSVDIRSVDKLVDYIIVFQNLETEEYDAIVVPKHHYIQPPFGFTFKRNEELLESLQPGDIIPKGTTLADSPGIAENNGYKYGVNANMLMATVPETSEDGVIISESLAKRLTYDCYEKRVIEFGKESFPLNLYGDKDNFKPFPEIGEYINPDGVLMAIRKYDDILAASTVSINDLQTYNPIFDKVCYAKAPGNNNQNNNEYGVVVDIKLYTTDRWQKDLFTGMDAGIEKYNNGLVKFHKEFLDVYNVIKQEHYKFTDSYEPKLSETLQQLLLESMSIGGAARGKSVFTFKSETIDNVRIEFVIAYRNNKLYKGNKITGNSGDKGVIVDIRPDNLMPYTEINGERVRADIIMDPASIVSRMNIGRAYEHFFNATSRRCQYLIRQAMHYQPDRHISSYTEQEIQAGWEILLGLLELIETEQYDFYRQVGSHADKLEILGECLTKEVYLYYKVSSDKKAYAIVNDIQNSIYKPEINYVHLPTKDGKDIVTKRPMLIAPLYIMVLDKTAEIYLSTASAKVNHFGLPLVISSATKHDLPYRTSPTKTLSETETRLFTAYVSRKGIAELKDRANSLITHKEIYKNILEADKPSNIDHVIDRAKFPYGQDTVLEIINTIMNAAGVGIDYEYNF